MDEHYPHEYISGVVEFFGRQFFVTPDVLIPRLETEGLVRRARAIIRDESINEMIDIGAGSGIIGVSCADLLDRLIFLDISEKALHIAQKNFCNHFPQKEAKFMVSDLLSSFPKLPDPMSSGPSDPHSPHRQSSPLLLIANLPYIKDGDWKNMSPDTTHEPSLALFGGETTGFELYEKLFEQLHYLFSMTPGPHDPNTTIILIEFGYDQRQVAENILQRYPWEFSFFPDFAGIERFAEIRIFSKKDQKKTSK